MGLRGLPPKNAAIDKNVVYDNVYANWMFGNGTVYLAGITADDTSGDVVQQTRDTLANIEHYLTLAGSNNSKLLTTQIWLRDIADFDRMNSVWAMPVRATVEARLSGDSYRVEIMVTAAL